MRFVEDQRLVLHEIAVALGFRQQDAVGHEFDPRLPRGAVLEADLVADVIAERDLQLLSHPLRDAGRREPPGLGAADAPAIDSERLGDHFRELGGFSRAGFADDDHHRVRADGREDFLPVFDDRQFLGIIPFHLAPRGFHRRAGFFGLPRRSATFLSKYFAVRRKPGKLAQPAMDGSP